MKNVVLIGGGTGTVPLIKGIKDLEDINLSVIVTVADSGGSTGIIREEYNIPAIGDIRQVLIALSDEETILTELMSYRFKEGAKTTKQTISKHSLGNLIITAMVDIKNNFYEGIEYLSKIFNIKGEIVPISDDPKLQLKAIYSDGTTQVNEHLIPKSDKKIVEITYADLEFKTNERAVEVIKNADYIILGCGSLYTSLIANLSIPAIKNAIIKNKKAKVIYFCNLVTQPNETDNMNAYDHVNAIEKHLEYGVVDSVIINNKMNNNSTLYNKYLSSNQEMIFVDEKLKNSHCEIIEVSLIDNNNEQHLRHDVKKVRKVIKEIIK